MNRITKYITHENERLTQMICETDHVDFFLRFFFFQLILFYFYLIFLKEMLLN